MCGIFFSLSEKPTLPNSETKSLLIQRGPDSCQTHTVQRQIQAQDGASAPITLHLTFISTVLSLRGDHVYKQPLVGPAAQSVLCWNGEAWKIANERVSGNDTELVFNRFLQAVGGDADQAIKGLAGVIASISGPFAFVFYDAVHGRVFFSRDCLGRRSLLRGLDEDGSLKLCSLCDGSSTTHFQEVGFEGVFMIDLDGYRHLSSESAEPFKIDILPWSSDPSPPAGHIVSLRLAQTITCTSIADSPSEKSHPRNEHVCSRGTTSCAETGDTLCQGPPTQTTRIPHAAD